MAYIPFEKRTKTEQRKIIVNRLVVWVRIAAQDSARVKLEETMAHTGLHNAHVIEYLIREAHQSTDYRNESYQQAEELKLI